MKFSRNSMTQWVHASTICCTIHQNNFTRKKIQVIALQRSEDARILFMAKVSGYHPDMLIWVDETGSDRRNSIRSAMDTHSGV